MKPLNATKRGLLTGMLMIIASIFSVFVLKNPIESYFQFILYAIFCIGIVWSLLAYSKQAVEKKAFKDFFSIGYKTFIVVTLLMAVFTYIYFSFHTEFRDAKIAENSRLLDLQGDHLPKEIETNANELKKMFMPLMISITVFKYLIVGAIFSVVGSIFLSKRNKMVA